MSKVILVTGGAGFIGSHLCERLIKKKNFTIISLDNYSSGSRNNHVDGVTYIQGNTIDVENLISEKPDTIFHFGEYSRVEQSFHQTPELWKSNSYGTQCIINFALKNRARLIYAGSSTRFSTCGLGKNLSPYSWSKAANTDLIMNYSDWFGLNYSIVYFSNVYGGREIRKGEYATLIGIYKNKYINNDIQNN